MNRQEVINTDAQLHFKQLKQIINQQLENALIIDQPDAVKHYLSIRFPNQRPILESYLNNYLELAINHEAVKCLAVILAYEPTNPTHAIDINRIIDEDTMFTLLNSVSEYVVDKNTRLQMAKLLLEAGANPNLSDYPGYTPLHNAAMRRDPDLIHILLKHHANPNQLTEGGFSCFECLIRDLAEDVGNPEVSANKSHENEHEVLACVPFFLEYHAEPNFSKRDNFRTLANELGFTRVTELLDNANLYPCHVAATYMNKENIIQILKDTPFDQFKLQDLHGHRPSDIARKYNNRAVIDVLENYEAVYTRKQQIKTNYTKSSALLPKAIWESHDMIASYLTSQEFTMFSTVANMHINHLDDENQNENQTYLGSNP